MNYGTGKQIPLPHDSLNDGVEARPSERKNKEESRLTTDTVEELKVENARLNEQLGVRIEENAKLKSNFVVSSEEEMVKHDQLDALKGQVEKLVIENDALSAENMKVREELAQEKAKSNILISAFNKELIEEERLIRSHGLLQKNYDRLHYRYTCLTNSSMGRMIFTVWDVYNKITRKGEGKKSG